MPQDCDVCYRIQLIKEGRNRNFVAELETGYVVIGDHQFYKGYSLLLCKLHHTELHHLKPDFRTQFLQDMATTAEAVYKAFQPDKLNYELLGNGEPHLHWHLIPRRHTDPIPDAPIWMHQPQETFSDKHSPTDDECQQLVAKLKTTLNNLI